MTRQRLGILAAYVAAVGLALGVFPTRATACSISAGRPYRYSDRTYLVVRATSEMVSAARGLPPALAQLAPAPELDQGARTPLAIAWWQVRWRRFWDRFRPPLPYGQVVEVLRVGGPDTLRLRDALARSRTRAVLVPWRLAPNCGPRLNPSRAPAFTPGTKLFVTAELRAESGWAADRPTLDIMPAGDVAHRPGTQPQSVARGRASLSVDAYWRMYEHMPEAAQLREAPARALAQVETWARSFPADSLTLEGQWTLAAARLIVGGWERRRAGGAGRVP